MNTAPVVVIDQQPAVGAGGDAVAVKPKKSIQSAIPELTVGDERKCFNQIRKAANYIKPESLLYNGWPAGEFCLRYVLGHYSKRKRKQNEKNGPGSSSSEEGEASLPPVPPPSLPHAAQPPTLPPSKPAPSSVEGVVTEMEKMDVVAPAPKKRKTKIVPMASSSSNDVV